MNKTTDCLAGSLVRIAGILVVAALDGTAGMLYAQQPINCPNDCCQRSNCQSAGILISGASVNGGAPIGTDNILIDSSNIADITIDWTPYIPCGDGTPSSYCAFGIGRIKPQFVLDGAAGTGSGENSEFVWDIEEDYGPGSGRLRHSHISKTEELLAHGCKHTLQIREEMFDQNSCNSGSSGNAFEVMSNPITLWLKDSEAECANGPPGCLRAKTGRPVDLASGKMYHEMVDLRVDGALPIEFVRHYDSGSTQVGALGYGWQHNGMMHLEDLDNPQSHVFVDRDMRRIVFNCAHSTFAHPETCLDLWWSDNIEHLSFGRGTTFAWTIRDKHGTTYDFFADGKLAKIADRNANTLTYHYEAGTGHLNTITDSFGRIVTLHYALDTDLIGSISAGGRTIAYTYEIVDPDGMPNLTRVTFADGTYVEYSYSSHKLISATDTLGHSIEAHQYDGSNRVYHTQSDDGNYAYTIDYNDPLHPSSRTGGPNQ